MRSLIAAAAVVVLCSGGGAFAGGVETGKDASVLAKEIEGKLKRKANEIVRVQNAGCQFSIEFTNHNVTFLVPLRGSQVREADDAEGVVLINSGMVRKFKDRSAEPYERLYLRFDRGTIDQVVLHFQQVIHACET